MLQTVLLSVLDDNPYNARHWYDEDEIGNLAESMRSSGLVIPIQVRKTRERYQIVFGHRRVRAARKLKWKTIQAEVSSVSDDLMLRLSLIENLQRKNLSDYETGLALVKMAREFDLTYDKIAELIGYSKSHISNYIRMTELVDEETISDNPSLAICLHRISEHHARLLLRIEDAQIRVNTLRFVVERQLSVRDLERMIHNLRGWFNVSHYVEKDGEESSKHYQDNEGGIKEIQEVLFAEFTLPHKGDLDTFVNHHAFNEGFSVYYSRPPHERFENLEAREKEENWFFAIAPKLSGVARDIHVQLFNDTALATLYVDYFDYTKKRFMTTRGTVVFIRKNGKWKIIHEHWSKLTESLPGQTLDRRRTVPDSEIQLR